MKTTYVIVYRNSDNGSRRVRSITASSASEAWSMANEGRYRFEIVETVY